MWPGLVGKGPDSEPPIDLDTMLDLTAAANVDGVRFEGVDLFLFDPHVDIDSDRETLKRLADRIRARGFVVGSLVAPVWPPTGGGSADGRREERKRFLTQVKKGMRHRQDPSRSRHPPLRRRADRLGRQSGRMGEGSGRQHEAHRGDVPRSGRDRRRPRRAPRRRRRNLLGRHAQLEAHARAARNGRAPRHDSAFRPTWRTRCCSRWAATRPRIAFCRKATTGPIVTRSIAPSRR